MSPEIAAVYDRVWPALSPLSPRKQLLASVAFARRFAPLFTDETCHRILAVAERVADGEEELRALADVKNKYFARPRSDTVELPQRSAEYIVCELGFYARHRAAEVSGRRRADAPRTAAESLLLDTLHWVRLIRVGDAGGEWFRHETDSFRLICQDAAGVSPVEFDPRWVNGEVSRIAAAAYEARDFSCLPELADALDDAGCDQPDILAHCRGPGPHVRGCWVVDLVLGKA